MAVMANRASAPDALDYLPGAAMGSRTLVADVLPRRWSYHRLPRDGFWPVRCRSVHFNGEDLSASGGGADATARRLDLGS
jgi:hypothetical protein